MTRCPRCAHEIPEGADACPRCDPAGGGPWEAPTAAALSPPVIDVSPTASSFVPGTLFAGRFRIVGLIARGGMGEVYRADDLRLGQPVALKFLPESVAGDPNRKELFLNEVRLARRVSHPNVCRVHELFELDDRSFLAMEYVDGENLASLLRRIGRLPQETAIDIARQICLGLDAAHAQGVLHRDLKPENIMLDGRGRVRIMDFGIASVVGRSESESGRSGTPAYMPPERLAGQPATVASDLFSAGVVLYELFTGHKPWRGRSLAEREAGLSEPPVPPSRRVPNIDRDVERLILESLEAAPSRRPRSALIMARRLPGGDPLTAALAAGQTPAPDVVAAAGGFEHMPRRVAWPILVCALLCIGTALWLSRWTSLTQLISFDRPPAALAERARLALGRLGYEGLLEHQQLRFEAHPARLRWYAARGASTNHWSGLRGARPPVLTFWLRVSPLSLVPLGESGRVSRQDPPPLVPGMATAILDTEGRLVSLRVVPPASDAAEKGVAGDPDWATLFDLAGLDRSQLEPVAPREIPPHFADARAAWQGAAAGWADGPVRVEAAAFRGRPVSFDILGSWPRIDRDPAHEPREPRALVHPAETAKGLFALAVIVAAAFIVRRNLRLGRVDHRGALRTALFILATSLAAWLLDADHAQSFSDEVSLVMRGLGYALRVAVTVWLLYLALEPLVRRRWPRAIISWTRLLGGRWNDPLVGTDVLVGTLVGASTAVLVLLSRMAPEWLGRTAQTPLIPDLDAPFGLRHVAASLLVGLPQATLVVMTLVVVFAFLRTFMRREWLVLAVFLPLLAVGGVVGSHLPPPFGFVFTILVFGPVAVLLLRRGLVSFVTAIFTFNTFALMLSTDPGNWAATTTLVGFAASASLAIYGFRAAIGSRRADDVAPRA